MITTELENKILTICFDRSDKMNAITDAMYLDAEKALNDNSDNKDVRVVMFTGAGDHFTSGNDVVEFINNPPAGSNPPVLRFLLALYRFPKPVVVAINGLAVGIGTTMLAHCDYIVAADDARFKLPFVDLGACPEGGSSLLFPQLMGHSQAAELLMVADIFSSAKAEKVGLVNKVVPSAEVLAHAQKIAKKLSLKAPGAMLKAKALLKQSYYGDLETRMVEEIESFGTMLQSAEAKEALSAFVEKRAPDFSQY